eukprot:COSAG01_NODE_3894_length_5575_cov_746.141136_10_plen_45_part_01
MHQGKLSRTASTHNSSWPSSKHTKKSSSFCASSFFLNLRHTSHSP